MNILIVAATPFEITPLQDYLNHQPYSTHTCSILITGVGQVATAFQLGCELSRNSYDLVINAGIAGTFRSQWPLGNVVQVVSEQFAQLGAESANGDFIDIFSLGLLAPDTPPFSKGKMINPYSISDKGLLKATGITVDKVHGYEPSIYKIKEQFNPDIESMEGAAVFYACLSKQIKFLEIRAISNYVEARNRERWEIAKAIKNLNQKLIQLLPELIARWETE